MALEEVVLTSLRMVANASILVYRDPATGKVYINPDLQDNPLFRLGDVKGDQGIQGDQGLQGIQGDQGLQGIQGDQGLQGIQGDQGAAGANASPARVQVNATVGVSRQGVVAGLSIQYEVSQETLNKKIVVFRGMLKLVSTATGTASMQATVAGFTFTFPTVALAVNTQYLHYEVTVHIADQATPLAYASVRQSIALNGVAANAVQSNNVTQTGAVSGNAAEIKFKSPVTTAVTTLFAVTEIL